MTNDSTGKLVFKAEDFEGFVELITAHDQKKQEYAELAKLMYNQVVGEFMASKANAKLEEWDTTRLEFIEKALVILMQAEANKDYQFATPASKLLKEYGL